MIARWRESETAIRRALLWGLLLFGISLPLSKSIATLLLALLYPAAAVAALVNARFRGKVLHSCRQPLTVALCLYALVALFGVFFSEKPADGFRAAVAFSTLPAIYLLVSVFLDSGDCDRCRSLNIEHLLFAFLAGLLALNLIAMMTYLGLVGHRAFALPLAPLNVHHIWFSNCNALGIYAALSLLLYSPQRTSMKARAFLTSSLALAVTCVLLSTSRAAWFSLVLTLSIMMVALVRRRRMIPFAVFFIATAGLCVYWAVPFVHDRITRIFQDLSLFMAGNPDTSLGARLLMWKAALMMFLSHPLTGVGTGGYVPAMKAYIESGLLPAFLEKFNQPHNMYLFALATNGLAGLATLLLIFQRVLSFSVPLLRAGGDGRLSAFLAVAAAVHFLFACVTDSLFTIQLLRFSFAFIMGICVRDSLTSLRRSQVPDSASGKA